MTRPGPKPCEEIVRFLAKVLFSDGCWEWQGTTNGKGYGAFDVKRDGRWTPVGAHCWAYERWVGPIPDGLELDHLCENPLCVRPDHLEPVTRSENMRRAFTRQPENICAHGHDKNVVGWYQRKGCARRDCAECARIRRRNQYYANLDGERAKARERGRRKRRSHAA